MQIKSGRIPSVVPAGLSAGYGSSLNSCALCRVSIGRTEVEDEVCVAERRLNLHVPCYAAWRDECLHKLNEGALRGPPITGVSIGGSMSR